MNLPQRDDYIDIHTHSAAPVNGIFSVDVLMAHEERTPANIKGILYTFGIHPWHLNENNHDMQLALARKRCSDPQIIAIGEAGFDRIKGPSMDLQRRTFEEQVEISEGLGKPLVVHCVRAWDELLREHKKLRPVMPWLVHGFRGKYDLAMQLISRGMYISFWFDFILKPESSELIRSLPPGRLFLETDGADVNIADIYNKVSNDLEISVEDLKRFMLSNFIDFFKLDKNDFTTE
jgi:TatD DNase family protein